jgi:hypothetical protein
MAFNRFYSCKNVQVKLLSLLRLFMTCGLYYKHITTVNDDSSSECHLLTALESSFTIVICL